MAPASMTETMPGVSCTGAGRRVAVTVTASRKVSGSSPGRAVSGSGSDAGGVVCG